MLNKIKFNIENLKNIISGNHLIVLMQDKVYTLKGDTLPNFKNRIYFDLLNNRLYTLSLNGKRIYRKSQLLYGLMPNFCPLCGRIMGKRPLDSKYWYIHKRCMDCSISLLHLMIMNDTWKLYLRNFILHKFKHVCDLAILFYKLLRLMDTTRLAVIDADGTIQKWLMDNSLLYLSKIDYIILSISKYKLYIEMIILGTMTLDLLREILKNENIIKLLDK